MTELLTIKQASDWATEYLKKNITTSNIQQNAFAVCTPIKEIHTELDEYFRYEN